MKGKIDVTINRNKIKEDSKWDGLKGYITNSDLTNDDIIKHYSELWQIEKAFRISKMDLRIRPVYHRLKRRIQAHLIIAFTAYKVYKELERQLQIKKLGISVTQAIRIMGATFGITIQHPETKTNQTLLYSNSDEHKLLFEAFEV
jgi:transposase